MAISIEPMKATGSESRAAPATTGDDSSTSKVDPEPSVGKEAFLQLLVAQIKNQDPLNPADGVQFLAQLAQFSELEQMIEIRQEVEALRSEISGATASESSTQRSADAAAG
jgi:flagellar basal-body rod modification protein FlgD